MPDKTLIKICGLRDPENFTAAIECGADFIGLVFYPPSPRHIDIETARYLCTYLPPNVQAVALMVDPTNQEIEQVLNEMPISMLQLHGDESVERITDIKQKFGVHIMKALPLAKPTDLEQAQIYETVTDWLLFDAKPQSNTLPGGNGLSFDWSILNGFQSDKPWMLAGGLTPDNVAQAIAQIQPTAVDVSSGVESKTGIKDADKIRSFIQTIKQA